MDSFLSKNLIGQNLNAGISVQTLHPFSPAVHTLITTHPDADLDSIASLLAAKKLHPEGRVILPEEGLPKLRHFFVQSLLYLFDILPATEIRGQAVEKLVLVGTQDLDRLGALGFLVHQENVALVLYDHHPKNASCPPKAEVFAGNHGATTSLMVRLLKRKKLSLLPEEATLLALGIFDNTDHLLKNGTMPEDFEALAWLVRQGAHLPTVSDMLAHGLLPNQMQIIREMLESLSEIRIHGIRIALSRLSRESEVADLAFLAHHFMRLEKIPVFFLLARIRGTIQLLGRSRREDIDMEPLMRALGGKGGKASGEAVFRDHSFTQVENALKTLLEEKLPRRFRARDIMNGPAHLITPGTSFHAANQAMTRYKVNALLVTETGKKDSPLVGLITRQLVEQALSHAMGESPVQDYLVRGLKTLDPEATLRAIQNIIVGDKQRIIPIMNRGTITGVITRTDLLHLMIREHEDERTQAVGPPLDGLPQTRQITSLMKERLPKKILEILSAIDRTGQKTGMNAFIVGGFVRDLLLGRKNEDLDIVVEGDGIFFARTLADVLQAKVHAYAKFGTAVVSMEDGTKIDVVTARTEFYAAPAALPEVEKSGLRADLYRRDFTVNTLAIQLNAPQYGILIDYFSGQKDLQDKSIRIIHNLSFIEDPTRIFRAVRFESRFGFTIDELTERLITTTIRTGIVKKLSGPRTLAELISILEEENPVPAVERLDALQLLSTLHPALRLTEKIRHLLSEAGKVMATRELMEENGRYERWLVYFLCLLSGLDIQETAEICHTLRLARWQENLCVEERREADLVLIRLERDLPLDNSILYERLHIFKTEILLYMMAVTGKSEARQSLVNYLVNLRHIRPLVQGRDLVALGVRPGPHFKKILDQVRDAKLNGILENREEELAFLNHIIHMSSRGQGKEPEK